MASIDWTSLANDPDPLSTVAAEEIAPDADEHDGQECILISYDAVYNSKGDKYILETGTRTKDDFAPPKTRDQRAAMVRTRFFDSSKVLERSELEIRSPHIKNALKKVIGSYPGLNIGSVGSVRAKGVPQFLFHYRQELRDFALASSLDARVHIEFALQYMQRLLHSEIAMYDLLMHDEICPGLEFGYLWMAYKPGALLYHRDARGIEQIRRLASITRDREVDEAKEWCLKLEEIECNGSDFVRTTSSHYIQHYDGFKPLHELTYFPLQHHPEKDRIRQELIARGKRYVSLLGIHHLEYRGSATLNGNRRVRRDEDDEDEEDLQSDYERVELCSRIVIDSKEYNQNEAFSHIYADSNTKLYRSELGEHLRLSDEELLICESNMPGFSLSAKRWGYFDVSKVQEISFDSTAFDGLVLDDDKKGLIRSMVETNADSSVVLEDLIRGKGRGIIFLLHGPPGVGKTLTAESLAEYERRPLYTINCGDLSHSPDKVEQRLTRSLYLANRWNAIVLVDEADVFMTERSLDNLERNELVSVLLRILEYFQGVMFLTTNRIEVIDQAFLSRVHLSITYPALSRDSRRSLWQLFVRQLSGGKSPEWLKDDFLSRVSTAELNGRQIKNAMRVAISVAASAKRVLHAKDVDAILKALRNFSEEFEQQSNKRRADGGGPPSKRIKMDSGYQCL